MCTCSQFTPLSFPLISPWELIDGDRRQSIAMWQNVYYQPSRKWLLRGNFEPPDYDAVSHILNWSEQCIKVLQGDLVFHSLLGKEHTGAPWSEIGFRGRQAWRIQILCIQPYGRNREFSFESTRPRSMPILSPWTAPGETLQPVPLRTRTL